MRPLSIKTTAAAIATAASTFSSPPGTLSSPSPQHQPRSPWHSPVPYLFGGLAAMLGLIAFALLILACSYWRLSPQQDSEGGNGGGGDEEKESRSGEKVVNKVFEEKVLVIMAGEDKPTFLATPVMSKGCIFEGKDGGEKVGNGEKGRETENGDSGEAGEGN